MLFMLLHEYQVKSRFCQSEQKLMCMKTILKSVPKIHRFTVLQTLHLIVLETTYLFPVDKFK